MTLKTIHIGLIGAGNMARALISGLRHHKYPAKQIHVSNPSLDKLQQLQKDFGIDIEHDNQKVIAKAQVIILCVKPTVIASVCQEIAEHLSPDTLIISVAAGVSVDAITRASGSRLIIRAMPNLGAQIACSATCLYPSEYCDKPSKIICDQIFQAIGTTTWVNSEDLINVATALAGSGPAYFFYILEALRTQALELGLAPDDCDQLLMQTYQAAGKLASASMKDLAELRQSVTSPGGTTAAALDVLQQQKVDQSLQTALAQAYQRALEMANESSS